MESMNSRSFWYFLRLSKVDDLLIRSSSTGFFLNTFRIFPYR